MIHYNILSQVHLREPGLHTRILPTHEGVGLGLGMHESPRVCLGFRVGAFDGMNVAFARSYTATSTFQGSIGADSVRSWALQS